LITKLPDHGKYEHIKRALTQRLSIISRATNTPIVRTKRWAIEDLRNFMTFTSSSQIGHSGTTFNNAMDGQITIAIASHLSQIRR